MCKYEHEILEEKDAKDLIYCDSGQSVYKMKEVKYSVKNKCPEGFKEKLDSSEDINDYNGYIHDSDEFGYVPNGKVMGQGYYKIMTASPAEKSSWIYADGMGEFYETKAKNITVSKYLTDDAETHDLELIKKTAKRIPPCTSINDENLFTKAFYYLNSGAFIDDTQCTKIRQNWTSTKSDKVSLEWPNTEMFSKENDDEPITWADLKSIDYDDRINEVINYAWLSREAPYLELDVSNEDEREFLKNLLDEVPLVKLALKGGLLLECNRHSNDIGMLCFPDSQEPLLVNKDCEPIESIDALSGLKFSKISVPKGQNLDFSDLRDLIDVSKVYKIELKDCDLKKLKKAGWSYRALNEIIAKSGAC